MIIKEAVNQQNYCDNYNSTANLTTQVGLANSMNYESLIILPVDTAGPVLPAYY